MRPALAVCVLWVLACGAPPAATERPPPPRGTPLSEYLAAGDDAGVAPVVGTGTGFGDEAMILHVIDVGQGSATLLEFPCGAMLIDTGGEQNAAFDSEPVLLGYLDDFFARRTDLDRTLDALVITHPHIDHTRSIPAVLERYRVRHVIDNGDVRQDIGGKPQLYLHQWLHGRGGVGHADVSVASVGERGQTGPAIDPIGGCERSPIDPRITALWGAHLGREEVGHDPNDDSVVLRVDFGEASALLPGDIELLAIARISDRYADAPELLDADVYLVPHHGSRYSSAEHFVAAVSPTVAVVSMGPPDRHADTESPFTAYRFGHPNRDSIDHLAGAVSGRRAEPAQVMVGIRGGWRDREPEFERRRVDAAIYATGWDGHVVVTGYADGRLSVWTSGR